MHLNNEHVRISAKLQLSLPIAAALQGAGFPVWVCPNMDAWLKTHVAEISSTANALHMAGGDIGQLKRNREALVLMIRAIREGYRVLSALSVPVTPSIHKIIRWIPQPLLLMIIRRKLRTSRQASRSVTLQSRVMR